MRRIVLQIIMAIVVSACFFSFGFTFLPKGLNSKIIIAVTGIMFFLFDSIRQKDFRLPREMWISLILVSLFCITGFISVDINYTSDYSYATYFISFFTWFFASYAVCWLMRALHGKATVPLLVNYLAVVCVAQCFLALAIDKYPEFKFLVDSYVDQGQEFFTEVNRLYGIGAAVDGAGVRFSIVLIMIPAIILAESPTVNKEKDVLLLLLAFFLIAVIGNIISRTTILGVLIGFILFFINMMGSELRLTVFKYFVLLLLIFGIISVFLYKTDKVYEEYFRFAFEGFFNFFENGEWRTGSTDKLNRTMWIWPETTQGWVIGTGLYDNWIYGTDIGYCRLILYNGILGFSIFVLYFLYLAYAFSKAFPEYGLLFFAFLILSFLIWIKVSTDIFQIFAFFYFLDNKQGYSLFKFDK